MRQQRQEVETQQEQLAHHIVAVVALAIRHVLATVATHELVGEVAPAQYAFAAQVLEITVKRRATLVLPRVWLVLRRHGVSLC